jgi:ABC-type dipeptide/oligopeptide/nickel transport system ATPase component
VQAEIARLLVALQARYGTAFLFITHDLNLVRQIAHRVAVVYRGDLVDVFEPMHLNASDAHPYTQALLAAVAPRMDARMPLQDRITPPHAHPTPEIPPQVSSPSA